MTSVSRPDSLKRSIGLPLLVAYGVGIMVGAGIYVLTGAVAGAAGVWSPWAFALAGVIAAPTALSYAEFSARIPEAAGEAAYVAQGLRRDWLGLVVGLAIVVAGTVSAAAVLRGGAGYLLSLVDLPFVVMIAGLGLLLTAIAVLGALQSLAVAALLTALEVSGLVLIVWAGAEVVPANPTSAEMVPWAGIGAGAVLAFFAFIGFEDLVNMAEEVKRPERTVPRAILLSLVITSALYALVSWAAVRAVPIDVLSVSEQPLALVWQAAYGGEAEFLSVIAGMAALNGVLAQQIMAARVLYGLGRKNGALAVFAHAHPRFGTPMRATLLVGAVTVVGALALPVAVLAEATSSVLLAVFVLVNGALVAVKRRGGPAPFEVPILVPVSGLVLSALALGASVLAG